MSCQHVCRAGRFKLRIRPKVRATTGGIFSVRQTLAPRAWSRPRWEMAKRMLNVECGEGLSPAGLLQALGAMPPETWLPLLPPLEQHHANARLTEGSLRLESVEVVEERPALFALHLRYEWTAQLGCSDVNYRDTERTHAHFTYANGRVTLAWDEAGDRSTVDEF